MPKSAIESSNFGLRGVIILSRQKRTSPGKADLLLAFNYTRKKKKKKVFKVFKLL